MEGTVWWSVVKANCYSSLSPWDLARRCTVAESLSNDAVTLEIEETICSMTSGNSALKIKSSTRFYNLFRDQFPSHCSYFEHSPAHDSMLPKR